MLIYIYKDTKKKKKKKKFYKINVTLIYDDENVI